MAAFGAFEEWWVPPERSALVLNRSQARSSAIRQPAPGRTSLLRHDAQHFGCERLLHRDCLFDRASDPDFVPIESNLCLPLCFLEMHRHCSLRKAALG
jgi:hypothetical protein